MTTNLIETMARAIRAALLKQSPTVEDAARAALSAIEASGTHRVVPVEMTPEMAQAAGDGFDLECYAAMLAAAPKVTE